MIVILSQENSFHANLAQKLKNDILNQAAKLKVSYDAANCIMNRICTMYELYVGI